MDRDNHIEELTDTIHLNYDCSLEFAKGLAEFLFDESYRKVVEGKWVSASNKPGTNIGMKCSICGARIKNSEHSNGNHRFCHKCGARMTNGGR